MKKIVLTLLSIASISICNNSYAKDYYAGGNIGMANLSSQVGSSFAINGFFGHDFNKYLGIEADATYFMAADYSVNAYSNGARQASTGQISQFFLGGAIKTNLPLTERLGLYGKAGLGYTMGSLTAANGSQISFDSYNGQTSAWFPTTLLGAGIKYDISKNLDIHFEDMNYISYVGGNLLAIGMSFKF